MGDEVVLYGMKKKKNVEVEVSVCVLSINLFFDQICKIQTQLESKIILQNMCLVPTIDHFSFSNFCIVVKTIVMFSIFFRL